MKITLHQFLININSEVLKNKKLDLYIENKCLNLLLSTDMIYKLRYGEFCDYYIEDFYINTDLMIIFISKNIRKETK